MVDMISRFGFQRRWVGLLVALVVAGLWVNAVQACPTCKVALDSHDKAQGDFVNAYMYSILFMMAMPFTIVAGFVSYLYYITRQAQRAAALKAAAAVSGVDDATNSIDSSKGEPSELMAR